MKSRTFNCILVVVLLLSASIGRADPVLSISPDYVQTSENVRKRLTVIKYQGVVTNSGDQTATGALGFVTSSDPNVEVRDDKLRIGNIGNGITQQTSDTFKVRIPNGYVVDPAIFSWTFTFKKAINNIPPVADPGNDTTVFVDQLVMLDGSGSTDPEGLPLTYDWEFVSVPPGSTAALSDSTALMPIFTVDLVGDYVIQLVVRDNRSFSTPATVTITTINSIPVANAGPDQAVLAGDTVTLDGSGSADVDGDPLTFDWTITSAPPGSTALLGDAAAVMPTFVADLAGTYDVQLVVTDGLSFSTADIVMVVTSPTNTRPVADAGPDLSDVVAATVTLDGSGSSDADGNGLTYSWMLLSQPTGSTALISNNTAAIATFVPDFAGQYVAQLIVNDGLEDGDPDTALVTIEIGNTPPVADAGPDQALPAGMTVALDGSASFDADGDGLTFEWSLTTVPATSLASMQDPFFITPTFEADKKGVYIAQLIVNDGMILSDPATVTITALNRVPVAVAGGNQGATAGDTVNFDGSASTDDDGDPLTYSWTLVTRPASSIAALANNTSATPSLTLDKSGIYEIQLIVNDGEEDSAPDGATVTAAAQDLITTADSGTTLEDTSVTVDVLVNDSSPAGDPLSISGVTPGANGSVTTDGATVTYTPNVDFNGADAFSYDVTDGSASATVAVDITVTAVNDQPLFDQPIDMTILEDSVDNSNPVSGVVAGPANELQALSVVAIANDAGLISSVVVNYTSPNPGGELLVTPVPGASGSTVVTVTLTDDGGTDNGGINSLAQTFNVTVLPVNDPPLAVDDAAATDQDVPVDIAVLTNDQDSDGPSLTVSNVNNGTNGATSTNGILVTYTPNAGFVGVDTFTYTAFDGEFGSDATVTVTVNDATPPIITPSVIGTLGNNGWYVSGVDVSWTVTDLQSPISSSTGCEQTYLIDDMAGVTLTCTAISDGGTNSASVTLKKDSSAPAITWPTPAPGAGFYLNESVEADYQCDDVFAGVQDCTGTTADASSIDTSVLGEKTYEVTATDNAGNTQTFTRTYNVVNQGEVIITTVAGGGPTNTTVATATGIGNVSDVVVDGAGNSYLVSRVASGVLKVDASGHVTRYAGTGVPGFSGDGGLAVDAQFYSPQGISIDSAGNIYVADARNHRIRRVDAVTGVITTVAGNGSPSFSGDNGPAIGAALNNPSAVHVDVFGNILIADEVNYRLRKIDTSGVITTIAGNGTYAFAGDGGLAVDASIQSPRGLTADSDGNVLIADANSRRVRKVDASTGLISTIAGSGVFGSGGDGDLATDAYLSDAYDVAVDSQNNIFIAERSGARIRRVDSTTNIISTVAGTTSGFGGDGGPAVAANLNQPEGVAVDLAGNLYITEAQNRRLRRVDAAGVINTLAGDGSWSFHGDGLLATQGGYYNAYDVASDANGNLFVVEDNNDQIVRIDAITGIASVVAGTGERGFSGDGGSAIDAQLSSPRGLAFDGSGNLFISDQGNGRIRKVDSGTGLISTVAGGGVFPNLGDGGPATAAYLQFPDGLIVDIAGNLIIADDGNNRIRQVDTLGKITTIAGNGTSGFSGDGGLATDAMISRPVGVSLDSQGRVYIADRSNHRVRRINLDGTIETIAGNGSSSYSGDGGPATSAAISFPAGTAVDAAGNLLIADSGNHVVRRVNLQTGVIDTPIGDGERLLSFISGSFKGDGGAPDLAGLSAPRQVRALQSGDIVIADTGNNRIRKVGPAGGFVDSTPPVVTPSITGTLGDNGWYVEDVDVSWTQDDPDSAITAILDCNPGSVTTDTASAVFNCSATSTGGTTNESLTIQRDATVPDVTVTAPAEGALFNAGQVVNASYLCTDVTSGVASCAGPAASGAAIDTSSAGPQTFTVTGTDSAGNTTQVAVNYTVDAVNGDPVANADPGIVVSEDSIAFVIDVLANDTDPDGDTLTVDSVVQPANGTITNAGNILTYTPNPDFFGLDPFSYAANDGNGGQSGSAAVTVTVVNVNDPPFAFDDTATTNDNTSVDIDVLTNDTDIDGPGLTVSATNNGSNGTTTTNGTTITYTPNADFVGVDTFTYTASDGEFGSAATVMVTVTDSSPPTITPNVVGTLGDNGWYVSGADVSWTVTDLQSPISSSTGCEQTYLIDDTAGITMTCTATSDGGTDAASLTIRKDSSAPAITWPAPAPGAGFYLDEVVTADYQCDDSGSGVLDCTGTTTNATPIDTSTLGEQTYDVTATDSAGNTQTFTRTYNVVNQGEVIVTTIAGGGPIDSVPALDSGHISPSSVAVDGSGNIYYTDVSFRSVWKLDASGVVTLIAGNGLAGFSGDGGPASQAQVFSPLGIAVDLQENLLIADQFVHRVRRIDFETGVITTIAGTGQAGFTGDGSLASSARLQGPRDVAVDSAGNIYVLDSGNYRVRRIATDGTISTVLGTGVAGFTGDGGPANTATIGLAFGIAVDQLDNLYIADSINRRVRRVDSSTGIITTIAGNGTDGRSGDGGAAVDAQISNVRDIAIDPAGHLFLSSPGNDRIRRIDGVTGVISTFAGTGIEAFFGDGGPATSASMADPGGLAIDRLGRLVFADGDNSRLRRIDALGIISTVVGSGRWSYRVDNIDALRAGRVAGNNAIDALGNLFVTDYGEGQIVRIDAVTRRLSVAAGSGSTGFSGDGGLAILAELDSPSDVALDSAGNLYIADRDNFRVRRVDIASGVISTYAGNGLNGYTGDGGPASAASLADIDGIAIDAAGNLAIADRGAHVVRVVDTFGIIRTIAGTGSVGFSGDDGPATSAQLFNPIDVTYDRHGRLFISDRGNYRIRRVDLDGTIRTVAGNGGSGLTGDGGLAVNASLTYPNGLFLDLTGDLYFSDELGDRVRRVDATTGVIERVAGGFGAGFIGDGGPPLSAGFDGPGDILRSPGGGLLIPDVLHNRIREIAAAGGWIDGTPPIIAARITGALGLDGWYVDDVTIDWVIDDLESPVISVSGCLLSTVSADNSSDLFNCSATSTGGTTDESITIQRDATAPIVNVTLPADGATYDQGAVVDASYDCTDVTSGVASCAGTVASGVPVDTSTEGPRVFTVIGTDSAGNSTTVDVNYSVVTGNLPPNVQDDTGINVDEDSTNNLIAVLTNDSDPDGDPTSIASVTQPANGVAAINGNNISYTPNADYYGDDTFTYIAQDDSNALSAAATVTVTVDPVNDAPTIDALGNLAIDEDDPAQIVNLSGIGSGAANEAQLLTATASSSDIGVVPNPTVTYTSADTIGSIEFTPVPDANGEVTITVTVTDDGGTANGGVDTFAQTFTLTVNPVDDDPSIDAIADMTIDEDSGIRIVNFSGVDSGAANEDQVLVATATSDAIAIIPNPTVNYTSPAAVGTLEVTPAADAFGSATVQVTVSDGGGNDAVESFDIIVNPVNDAPTIDAIANLNILEDAGQQTVNLTGIGTGAPNETQILTIAAVSSDATLIPNPTVNYTSANPAGSLTFTPVSDAFGAATISVTVTDDGGTPNGGQDSTVITFDVIVAPVNDAPALDPIGNTNILEDAGVQVVNLTGIATGAANEVQDFVVVATSSNPAIVPNPTVTYTSADPTGSVAFTPVSNAFGNVTITVTVTDDGGMADGGINQVSQAFDVSIAPVNDAPTLDPIANELIDKNAGLQTVNLFGITTGAANETQVLSVTAISNNQTVVPNPTLVYTSPGATGSLQYTPAAGQFGVATITVTLSDDGGIADGGNDTVQLTFDITVEDVNGPPVAFDDSPAVDEDSVDNSLLVLANDLDDDGDTLNVLSFTQPTNGTVSSVTGSTHVLYTPDPDYFGNDVFTYIATDGNGGDSAPATVTVRVQSINDGPNAVDDPLAFTDEDVAVVLDVMANDTDPEGDSLTIASVTVPTSGTTSTDGAFVTYTPSPQFSGVDFFVYTITDGNGGSASATVTVTVNGVNDAPVALDDSYTINEDVVSILSVLDNDTDVDFDAITITNIVPGTLGGAVSGGGGITYTPAPNVSGVDTIGYTISDGNGGVDSATVTVTILPVNDLPTADAGPDQNVLVGDFVTLDGSASSDIDGPSFEYQWTLTSSPTGSSVVLAGATTVGPTFTPDVAGDYVVSLLINDGLGTSEVDIVRVIASSAPPTVLFISPSNSTIETRDAASMTVTLDQPALAGGQLVDLSSNSTVVSVPASVTVPLDEISISFDVSANTDTGAAIITGSAIGLVGDVADIQVGLRTFSPIIPLVGIDRTVAASLELAKPAPVGGATFDLTILDTGIVTVSPASIFIAEGQSSTAFSLTGGFTINSTSLTVDGTADGYESQTFSVDVTDRLIDLPTSAELAFGEPLTQQVLIAPDPAPPGGLQIEVVSSDPSIVQVLTPTVVIPEGLYDTTIDLQAGLSVSGTAIITASNPSFAPDTSAVTVTRSLAIVESYESFESGALETTYFEISSGGELFKAASGGVTVSVSSDNTDCVVASSPGLIPEGESFGSTSLSYAGVDALPCTALVTVSNPVFGLDVVPVTVESVTDVASVSINTASYIFGGRLGSGLQGQASVALSTGAHGGILVQVESDNSGVMRFAPDSETPGRPVTEVWFADGETQKFVYVQGVRGQTGDGNIVVKHPSLTTGLSALSVVPSGFQIAGIALSSNTLAADDPFYVNTYSTTAAGATYQNQAVSAEGPLTVTFTSSDPSAGVLTTTSTPTASSVTVDIAAGVGRSPTTVALGGVAFDALAQGTTIVSATAAGFDPTVATSSASVDVTQPGMSFQVSSYVFGSRLGSGLQGRINLTLAGADHGGVTVRIESSDAAVLRMAPDAVTVGTQFIDVVFADGETQKLVYVQGVRGATGAATVTASSPLFADGTTPMEVVPSGFQVTGIALSSNTLAADDPFYVNTYSTTAAGAIQQNQAVSAEGPLTVTFTSSDPSAGVLTTTSTPTASSVTVDIAAGVGRSPTTVALGGVAFDALAQGTTIVSATAAGFDPTVATSSVSVDVTQPGMSFQVSSYVFGSRLGSGLQGRINLTLAGADHGGVTVRIESSDAAVLRMAPDAVTVGTQFIDVVFADGETQKLVYVQGVRGATGTANIVASSPLFADGTAPIEVVPSGFQITAIALSSNTLAADDPFYVNTYSTTAAGAIQQNQAVSAEGPLTVTFTSSDPSAGVLTTTSTPTASSVTVDIAPGVGRSPTTVALGGVAFDALAQGTTIVSATAAGFDPTVATSSVSVDVTQPGMNFNVTSYIFSSRLGSGLQGRVSLTLAGADHGGVTVRVASSNPAVLKIAPDSATPGTSFVEFELADGETQKFVYVQGVRGELGSVTITGSSPQFVDGTAPIEVVPSGFQIAAIALSSNTLAADDPFYVNTYSTTAAGAIQQNQAVSAEGPLSVTFTSSDPSAGVLTTTSTPTAASVTVDIAPGVGRSPTTVALGGVAFDALAQGTTIVSATAAGFDPTVPTASVEVTVNP